MTFNLWFWMWRLTLSMSRDSGVTAIPFSMCFLPVSIVFTVNCIAFHAPVYDRDNAVTLLNIGGICLFKVEQRGVTLRDSAATDAGEKFARAGDLSTAIKCVHITQPIKQNAPRGRFAKRHLRVA